MNIQPFTIDVINEYRSYYLLNHIKNVDTIQFVHNTPAGSIEVDFADAFRMNNGRIVVAWKKPLDVAPMHNIVAISGQTTENVNMATLERVIDIYDRPVDAQKGTFIFTNSDMVIAPNTDWRCDSGKYGPIPFQVGIKIIDKLSEISVYEPILCINGVAHLFYIEGVEKQQITKDYLTSGEIPTVGRTLWETLKLIREWAIVNEEPFNNPEAPAFKASQFIKELKLSDEEVNVIDSQIPMQISNYINGDTNARQRPNGILPATEDVKHILFSRMASGVFSVLEYFNPGLWDFEELLQADRDKYNEDMYKHNYAKGRLDPNQPALIMRDRIFTNKNLILSGLENGTL